MADDSGTEDLSRFSTEMERLDGLTKQFGRTLSRTFASGIMQGRGFEGMLRTLGERMIELALRASFKPLESGITSLLSQGLGSLFGQGSTASPFSFPTLTSALGTASPIIAPTAAAPLAQPPTAPRAVTVNVAISTPDAESFRRSEGQVSATLARAVARGQRNL